MTVHCTISEEVNKDGYEAGVEEVSEGSEYEERESTPSTTSTDEDSKIKPSKAAKDYLVSSNANDLINLSSINKKWILKSGFDLSSCFLKRRNDLVNSCSGCDVILKPDEELSINGIILLDDDAGFDTIRFDRYEEACNEVKERYSKYEEDDIKSNVDEVFQFSKVL